MVPPLLIKLIKIIQNSKKKITCQTGILENSSLTFFETGIFGPNPRELDQDETAQEVEAPGGPPKRGAALAGPAYRAIEGQAEEEYQRQ